jgi:uncharacterized membrane protein YdjX (TVP38/TMEM64 family)
MSLVDLDVDTSSRSSTVVWAQRGVVAGIWVAAIVGWQVHQSSTGRSVTESAQSFIDVVGGSWWGVFAYVLVYLARPIVLFPASILTIVGGILFGPVLGVLVVVLAANASAMIAYGVGRLLGRPLAGDSSDSSDSSEASIARRWSNRMRTHSFETVLVMRLLFLPYDLVNYLAGLLRLRWMPFLLATALGSLPGTVSFVLLGASLDRVDEGLGGIDPVALVAGMVIFVVSLAVAQVLRRRQPGRSTLEEAAPTT